MKSQYNLPNAASHAPIHDLPLFAWQQIAKCHPLTRAGALVARRYAVPAEIADVTAALAGLGVEMEAR